MIFSENRYPLFRTTLKKSRLRPSEGSAAAS